MFYKPALHPASAPYKHGLELDGGIALYYLCLLQNQRSTLPTLIHHYSTRLPPAELDRYLTSGWRPAGQAVYTADYLRTDGDELYGCIQVRLPLEGFAFKKRHRKMLRRNDARFRIVYGQATAPDTEILDLNRRYMAQHPEKSREQLDIHVSGEFGNQALDTRIVRVYDEERLVAFSYFDAGERTAYTKAGIYDPDYANYSLGIYTMLLEIRWLVEHDYAFYHPGYVVPEYPMFDYKLQFGPMEYRQLPTGKWLLFDPAQPENPYRICEAALLELQSKLTIERMALLEYPSFTARYHHTADEVELLDAALLLRVFVTLFGDQYIVVFNPHQLSYELIQASESYLRDVNVLEISPTGRRRAAIPLVVENQLFATTSLSEMAEAVQSLFGR